MQDDVGEKEDGEISPIIKSNELSSVRVESNQEERSPTASKNLDTPEKLTVPIRVVQETSGRLQQPLTVPRESDGLPPGNRTTIISNGMSSSPIIEMIRIGPLNQLLILLP